ncbi:MAG: tRNA (guanosine(46)-N7)-methyltransferase TrmB [Pseudomonadota bacterium]|nr:tRNA (guanosine(46)-N7)-methyltransferase TrmB [Pseudomonadota bacterium]
MKLKSKAPDFYGRRKGHRLRRRRRFLVEKLLPEFSISLNPSSYPLHPKTLFEEPMKDIWMEIGFGSGEHLVHQANLNPNIGFLGVEPFINGVAALLDKIDAYKLANIKVLNNDIKPLLEYLAPNSIGKVFMLFSDPWPKKRHKKRRLLSPGLLDELSLAMRSGSELVFASDHMDYVRDSLEIITERSDYNWNPKNSNSWKSLHTDTMQTRYETKASNLGLESIYLKFDRL